MKLGISAAMPGELQCLTRKIPPPGQPFELAEGVIAIHSGMGPEKALAAAHALLDAGATAILSWGCATALDDGLRPGTLLLPQFIIRHDGRKSPVEEGWHERLCLALAGMGIITVESLAESPTILKDRRERTALREKTGALAADMESGALARAAEDKDAAFLAVRVIADCAEDPVPPFVASSIDDWGRVNWLCLLFGAFLRPGDWKALATLNRHFKASQATLKAVSELAGPDFKAFS